MKDSQHVISVTKPLNLFDLNIRPVEICWSKVKMTSSRWIACCHRRLVQPVQQHQQQQFTPHRLQRAAPIRERHHHQQQQNTRSEQAVVRGSSPTFVRSLAAQNQHHLQQHYQHSTPLPSHGHLNGGSGHLPKTPVYPNDAISTSYQTPPRHRPHNGHSHHHHHHHRNSSHPHHHLATTSANPSTLPQRPAPSANSSPLSSTHSSVVFELGSRKSSSTSSSSSSSTSNSFTLVGDRLGNGVNGGHVNNTSMKHSRSTVDIPSSALQRQQLSPLRHQQHYYGPRDDSAIMMGHPGPPPPPLPAIENTITIISPLDGLLINCQTTEDSNCAQISPELNVIAVSNDYWVAFYSIKSNECLGTLQFPGHCRHWTWIKADTVAVVTEEKVFHWSLAGGVNGGDSSYLKSSNGCGAFLREIFDIDEEFTEGHQITDYATDPLFGNWCALSTLYVDDDGEIGGKVQIYSHSYRKSQCIDAHSAIFTAYQFDDSEQRSTLLVAAIRQKNRTWKLHIIELGPIPGGNISHKPIHHMLNAHNSPRANLELLVNGNGNPNNGHPTEDIPTHIVADSEVGLVYLLSKYGSLYICDLETGAPLFFEHLKSVMGSEGGGDLAPIFSLRADAATESLVAVSRGGQVISIAVSLPALLRQAADNAKVGQKVLERIRGRLRRLKRLKDEDGEQQEETVVMVNGDKEDNLTAGDSAYTGSTQSELAAPDDMQQQQQNLNNGHNNNGNGGSSSNGYNSIDSAHSSTTATSSSTTSSATSFRRHRPPVKPKPPKTKPKPERYHFGNSVAAAAAEGVNGDPLLSFSDQQQDRSREEELSKSGRRRSSQPQPQLPFPEPPFDGEEEEVKPDNEQITRL